MKENLENQGHFRMGLYVQSSRLTFCFVLFFQYLKQGFPLERVAHRIPTLSEELLAVKRVLGEGESFFRLWTLVDCPGL